MRTTRKIRNDYSMRNVRNVIIAGVVGALGSGGVRY